MLIVDRGRPIARLEAVIECREGGQAGRLSRLLRDGLIRPRRAAAPQTLFSSQPRATGNVSAVDALIQERREEW